MLQIERSHVAARCRELPRLSLKFLARNFGLVATLVFAAIFISPQFVDGYVGEDLLTANTPGYLQLQGIGLGQHLSEEFNASIGIGRFCPLAPLLTYGVHAVARSAAAYHGLVFGLLLTDVALFYCLLRVWRVGEHLAGLGALFVTLLFQLRVHPDPILQFDGLLPALVALVLVAMIAFERHLATGGFAWQLASLGSFAVALLTYEIAFAIAPVFVVMAARHRGGWRQSLNAAQAQFTLVFTLLAFLLGLRFRYGWNPLSPYCPRFDLAAIGKSTALQASAAIPTSYALLSSHRIDNMWERRLVSGWQNWAMFVAAGALTWFYLRQLTRETSGGEPANIGLADAHVDRLSLVKLLAAAGGVLWISPGLLPALSPLYQATLSLGLGHIAVYLQYFGVALLAIAAISLAAAKLPSLWPKLIWGVVGVNASIAMLTFDTNVTVAARINADPTPKSMQLVESACHAGLFDSAPDGATIWSVQSHAWMCGGAERAGGHLSKTLGRLLYALIGEPTPDWRRRRMTPDLIPAPTFVMNDLWPNLDWAYVVLGAVDSAAPIAQGSESYSGDSSAGPYPVRNFRLFLNGSYVARSSQTDQLAIAVVRRDAAGVPTWRLAQWIDLAKLNVVERNGEGVILEGAFATPVDMRLVCVIEAKDVTGRLRAESTETALNQ